MVGARDPRKLQDPVVMVKEPTFVSRNRSEKRLVAPAEQTLQ